MSAPADVVDVRAAILAEVADVLAIAAAIPSRSDDLHASGWSHLRWKYEQAALGFHEDPDPESTRQWLLSIAALVVAQVEVMDRKAKP